MIEVTKLSGHLFIVNADQIETIETTPDTVITVTSGRKYVVRESVDEVLSLVSTYHGGAPDAAGDRRGRDPQDPQ